VRVGNRKDLLHGADVRGIADLLHGKQKRHETGTEKNEGALLLLTSCYR